MDAQIEHLRPEIRHLLVANALFAGHVCPSDQPLAAGVLPMRLAAHPAHDSIRIKRKVAYRINPFLLGLEILRNGRAMWAGQRRVANQIEVWLRTAADDGETHRKPVAALGLDVAQHGFALETVEAFAHG